MAHKPTPDRCGKLSDQSRVCDQNGVKNQKWVDGVRAFPQVDQRPVDGM